MTASQGALIHLRKRRRMPLLVQVRSVGEWSIGRIGRRFLQSIHASIRFHWLLLSGGERSAEHQSLQASLQWDRLRPVGLDHWPKNLHPVRSVKIEDQNRNVRSFPGKVQLTRKVSLAVYLLWSLWRPAPSSDSGHTFLIASVHFPRALLDLTSRIERFIPPIKC